MHPVGLSPTASYVPAMCLALAEGSSADPPAALRPSFQEVDVAGSDAGGGLPGWLLGAETGAAAPSLTAQFSSR